MQGLGLGLGLGQNIGGAEEIWECDIDVRYTYLINMMQQAKGLMKNSCNGSIVEKNTTTMAMRVTTIKDKILKHHKRQSEVAAAM